MSLLYNNGFWYTFETFFKNAFQNNRSKQQTPTVSEEVNSLLFRFEIQARSSFLKYISTSVQYVAMLMPLDYR